MPDFLHHLPPGLIMVVGAVLLPLLGRRLAAYGALALSLASMAIFWFTPFGEYGQLEIFGNTLNMVRIDRLSFLFGLVFHIAAITASIYALHVEDTKQHIAGMMYAGGAIAASCAGDLVTLFVCWELTAISSVVLIWATGTQRSYRAGMRYLIIQVGSGVLLLSGAIIHFHQTGSLTFEHFMGLEPGAKFSFAKLSIGPQLILAAFAIKCAFPLLHNWLQDSYPKATVTGTVFLSAFTTKLAIYSLARGFHGMEELIWIGCAMTLFPIVFAVIENDLRRVLAYSLNNQLGFMVVGIGIGSELALNGTAAHAFCHIIYKALLFMSMGAVLHRVGTCKASELGGLHKSMPLTTVFCTIGAGAISGFPLLSGFVSKSMIITAAGEAHMLWVWIVLLIASAGVMEHSGIKIPFFAFFAHDSGKRPKEAPWNMLLAMGIAATLCVWLGIAYSMLYDLLPYPFHEGHEYVPYTNAHVVMQFQLLLFAALAFVVLMKLKIYPAEVPSENLDTDWFYRRLVPMILGGLGTVIAFFDKNLRKGFLACLRSLLNQADIEFNEKGIFGRAWSTSAMAVWAALLLGVFLMLYYL
jgi:multicomponent Na+:H+ antiporter subunit D